MKAKLFNDGTNNNAIINATMNAIVKITAVSIMNLNTISFLSKPINIIIAV
jgi:hypothetical protein